MQTTKAQKQNKAMFDSYILTITKSLEGSEDIIKKLIEYLQVTYGIHSPVRKEDMKLEILCKREGVRDVVLQLHQLISLLNSKKPTIHKP